MNNLSTIKEKLSGVVRNPGVYLLKDRYGKILYVGKARDLQARLRSHFFPGRDEPKKHASMMRRVVDFDTIVTDSEVEALILEANFIKEHRPRYNINLRDDKSYPYVRVTNENYPRVFVTRKIVRDGSRYFGPYTDAGNLRLLISAIRKIFPIRTCRLHIDDRTIAGNRHRVCLNYHIGRCSGPCEGLISREDYTKIVEQVVSFIQGKDSTLVAELEKRMDLYANQHRFEEAAKVRDRIRAVSMFRSRQKVVDEFSVNRDMIAVAVSGDDACGVVFNVREGKMINMHHFYMKGTKDSLEDEILISFLKQYYFRSEFVPREIFVDRPVDVPEDLRGWLAGKRGGRVDIVFPVRGKKARLMAMCRKNAELLLNEFLNQKRSRVEALATPVKALQRDLKLPKQPIIIEAFDISNISGKHAVGSVVVFENGRAKRGKYRRFRIKTVDGIDDFKMMAEVVERRLRRLKNEGSKLPDLIVVDGGKGQLSAAFKILERLSLKEIPLIAIAKRLDEVFIPGIPEPQNIPHSSPGLRLLLRIRDEAHRFAIQYHRRLRKREGLFSILDDIPGIGEKRRRMLLEHFGSTERIRTSSVDEIAKLKGINKSLAARIVEFLNKEG